MILSILGILIVSSVIATIIHASKPDRVQLWVPVLLLEIAVALMAFGGNSTPKMMVRCPYCKKTFGGEDHLAQAAVCIYCQRRFLPTDPNDPREVACISCRANIEEYEMATGRKVDLTKGLPDVEPVPEPPPPDPEPPLDPPPEPLPEPGPEA